MVVLPHVSAQSNYLTLAFPKCGPSHPDLCETQEQKAKLAKEQKADRLKAEEARRAQARRDAAIAEEMQHLGLPPQRRAEAERLMEMRRAASEARGGADSQTAGAERPRPPGLPADAERPPKNAGGTKPSGEKTKADLARSKAKALLAQQRSDALRREESERAARKLAEAAAKRRADEQRRSEEQGLRNSFRGHAATCPGGGAGVLYLQTSRPMKNGCNVRFEARCPGVSSGNGVTFGQYNYVGGSCFGVGDLIRIGQMSCPATQVQIVMTSASCG